MLETIQILMVSSICIYSSLVLAASFLIFNYFFFDFNKFRLWKFYNHFKIKNHQEVQKGKLPNSTNNSWLRTFFQTNERDRFWTLSRCRILAIVQTALELKYVIMRCWSLLMSISICAVLHGAFYFHQYHQTKGWWVLRMWNVSARLSNTPIFLAGLIGS